MIDTYRKLSPFVSQRWLLRKVVGLSDYEIDQVSAELRGVIVPLVKLTQDECIELEKDWDARALNAGLVPDDTVAVGIAVTKGLVLESGTVIVGANQLRALYRACAHEPRVEHVMRRIEATGMSAVDLLGGLG